jgi:hypothetical protein
VPLLVGTALRLALRDPDRASTTDAS